MAKLSEISELHLAALIAAATAMGGVLSSAADAFWSDASTDKATNVQLVQLAIGILSDEDDGQMQDRSRNRELRSWAVQTINAAAEVKFDEDAQKLLIEGEASLASAEMNRIFAEWFSSAKRSSADEIKSFPELPKSVPQKE
jgi:hypothetical protein